MNPTAFDEETLFTCALATELINNDTNLEILKEKGTFSIKYTSKHNLDKTKVSYLVDEGNEDLLKYLINLNEEKKQIIVAFRCTSSLNNFLIDVKLNGRFNKCQGRFHSGIFSRSESIPIKYFVEKIVDEDYTVVFTGHSLGAAVGALVAVRVLLQAGKKKNVYFIGFGSPVLADSSFKDFIANEFKDNFHFYINDDDVIVTAFDVLTNIIFENEEFQKDEKTIMRLTKEFFEFINTFSNLKPIIKEPPIAKEPPTPIPIKLIEATSTVVRSMVPTYIHFGEISYLKAKIQVGKFETKSDLRYCVSRKDEDVFMGKIQNHNPKNYLSKICTLIDSVAETTTNVDVTTAPAAAPEIKVSRHNEKRNIFSLCIGKNRRQIKVSRRNEKRNIFSMCIGKNRSQIKESRQSVDEIQLLSNKQEPETIADQNPVGMAIALLAETTTNVNEQPIYRCISTMDHFSLDQIRFTSCNVCTELKTDIFIRFACKNSEYIVNGVVSFGNEECSVKRICRYNNSVQLLFSLSHETFEKSNMPSIKLKLDTHFESSSFIIDTSDSPVVKLSQKRVLIEDLPVDMLYIYAMNYILMFRDLEVCKTKCVALENCLKEICEIWRVDAAMKHEFSNEELNGLLFSYYQKYDPGYKKRKFNDNLIVLTDCLCVGNLEKLVQNILPTCYYLKQKQSTLISLDSMRAFYLSAYSSYESKKHSKRIASDQGYVDKLKLFKGVKFDNVLPYVGFYEQEVVKESRIRNFAETKELKTVKLNQKIRNLLYDDCIFGVIGENGSCKSAFIEKFICGVIPNEFEIANTSQTGVYSYSTPDLCVQPIFLDYVNFDHTDFALEFIFSRKFLSFTFMISNEKTKQMTNENELPAANQQDSDVSQQLNQQQNEDPGTSQQLNQQQNEDSDASQQLNQQQNEDPGTSQQLNQQQNEDPEVSIV